MSAVTRKLPPIVVVLFLPEASARRASSERCFARAFDLANPLRLLPTPGDDPAASAAPADDARAALRRWLGAAETWCARWATRARSPQMTSFLLK